MKKVLKVSIKFLSNIALCCIMLGSAHKAMGSDQIWVGLGYIILFGFTLLIWSIYNSNTDKIYEEGYKDGYEAKRINCAIFEEINAGEKNEFEIEMPNFAVKEYIILFGRGNKFCSHDDKYKYTISCIENLGETSKIKFTKED